MEVVKILFPNWILNIVAPSANRSSKKLFQLQLNTQATVRPQSESQNLQKISQILDLLFLSWYISLKTLTPYSSNYEMKQMCQGFKYWRILMCYWKYHVRCLVQHRPHKIRLVYCLILSITKRKKKQFQF